MLFTLFISYVLWVLSGCDPFFPFISDLDLHPWTTSLFTAGLTLTGFMVIILSFQIICNRGTWFKLLNQEELKSLPLVNKTTIIPGIITGLGIIGIAWAPWNEGIEVHILLANAVFYGGVAWTSLATYTTWRMSKFDEKFKVLIKPRIYSAAVAFTGLIGMIWKVGQAHQNGFDFGQNESLSINFNRFCRGEANGSLGNVFLSQAAIFEWLLVLSMLYFTHTFIKEVTLINEARTCLGTEEE